MSYIDINKGSEELAVFYELWDEMLLHGEAAYKLPDCKSFEQLIISDNDPDIKKIAIIHDTGCAAACGCYSRTMKRAYITMIITDKKQRRNHVGVKLLKELERRLQAESGTAYVELSFFNPMNLSWCIPGHPGVEHPNAPGIDVSSPAYIFFKNCGYRDYAMQNSYYRSLSDYEPSAELIAAKQRLHEAGVDIVFYDSSVHYGMPEMLNRLDSPIWSKLIPAEKPISQGGRPILVPVKDGQVLGFTGPLDVEENGRGYFAGIAVDEAARGMGIAGVLFSALCSSLKEIGADYMTLFTAENNHARNIYEKAGFHIVKTWADMRKQL